MLSNLFKSLVAMALLLSAVSTHAAIVNFSGLNANEVDVSAQLSMEVTQVGNNVDFKISNAAGGLGVIVGHIYFDFLNTNLFTSLTQTGQQGQVSFTGQATFSQNFPEGNSINFTTDADANRNGGVNNGINVGEYITLSAVLNTNTDIMSLLMSGGLRVGLHIQGYSTGGSDSYVSVPPPPPAPVPAPAAAWLFGSGLIGFAASRGRQCKA